MSTICADLPLLHETPTVARSQPPRARARPLAPAPPRAWPRRYEDFEARTSTLGDLLGGQVFPRRL